VGAKLGKARSAYDAEQGSTFSSAAQSSGDQCLIDLATLARIFLMIYDGAAIQYMPTPQATDHRAQFCMMTEALLIKAGV